jgi:mannose-6-phosphate isomerase-like protein (cupin superfamily)
MAPEVRTGRLEAVRSQEAAVYPLPGRDWLHCIGPETTAAKNLTVGLSIFPAGSAPPGHVHETQEEVVYVLSGRGRLVAEEATVELEPGTCVYVPVGVHHATVSHGPEPLRLLCAFSPPVAPGSYEPSPAP